SVSVADGSNELTARAAGTAVVTAMAGGRTATAKVTVHAGASLPFGAYRWKNDRGLGVIETPPPDDEVPGPPVPYMLDTRTTPARQLRVFATEMQTGLDQWVETFAVSPAEQAVAIHRHSVGGGLVVVEARDGSG